MQLLMHKLPTGDEEETFGSKKKKKKRLGEADSQLPPTREPMEHSPSLTGS